MREHTKEGAAVRAARGAIMEMEQITTPRRGRSARRHGSDRMDKDQDAQPIVIDAKFYRRTQAADQALAANIETAVELYLGHRDRTKTDAAVNFEKALGILSVSYVKMINSIIREDWKKLTPERRLLMNFGIMDARLATGGSALELLPAELDRPAGRSSFEVFYLNEWFEKIGRGLIPLTSDVAQTKAVSQKKEQEERLRAKVREVEKKLQGKYKEEFDGFQELMHAFKELDPEADASDKLRVLKTIRKGAASLEAVIKDLALGHAEIDNLNTKLEGDEPDGGSAMDSHRADQFRRLREEFDLLVNVMRSCAVRGGVLRNTPVLIDKWIPLDTRFSLFTRDYVAGKLEELEARDPTIFHDKGGRRTPPKVLILPGVGTGMAWHDRIIMPLFPPPAMPPDTSLIRTLGSYRWFRATTSFNWKDLPGELGSAYHMARPGLDYTKLTKNFVDDYVDWMTREAQGFQVLDAEIRKLFWKHIPYPRELKEDLFKRATVYRQLYGEEMRKK